jgi:hypothetical protein
MFGWLNASTFKVALLPPVELHVMVTGAVLKSSKGLGDALSVHVGLDADPAASAIAATIPMPQRTTPPMIFFICCCCLIFATFKTGQGILF